MEMQGARRAAARRPGRLGMGSAVEMKRELRHATGTERRDDGDGARPPAVQDQLRADAFRHQRGAQAPAERVGRERSGIGRARAEAGERERRIEARTTGHRVVMAALAVARDEVDQSLADDDDAARAHSRPRFARLRIRCEAPKVQGSQSSVRRMRLTSAPSSGAAMVTMSPYLWVKPPPGVSRSSIGANMVPR